MKFSNDGQQFLVISGTTQAKMYDRDGEELCVDSYSLKNGQSHLTGRATFIKGDQYIRDMKNTSYVQHVDSYRRHKLTHGNGCSAGMLQS